ncbi:hypothetical protein Tco_0645372 [Tanacetum coccineum]
MYPKYIPLEDEHGFPAEEQPLPPVVSPTAESLGYVVESDPEEDLEEYEDDETKDYCLASGFHIPSTRGRASTQALVNVVTAALPSPPLPPLPPSLYIPPPIDRKDNIPESERPPRKKLCLFALGFRYEVREISTARPAKGRGIDYGFVSTIDAEAR